MMFKPSTDYTDFILQPRLVLDASGRGNLLGDYRVILGDYPVIVGDYRVLVGDHMTGDTLVTTCRVMVGDYLSGDTR